MIDQPFSIFASFLDRLSVQFFAKADNISSDADLATTLESKAIASLTQVHGNRTVVLRSTSNRIEHADGIITDQEGLWLSVRAADCQHFVIYAPAYHVCGVLHAGWKGLHAGAIPAFFEKLQNEWDIEPHETFVGAGPSLCTACAEFTNPIQELAGLDPRFFHGRHADLRKIADAQLEHLGIPAAQRERNFDCTKCMPEKYWTYRGGDRTKMDTGLRNVLVCQLKKLK